MTPPSRYSLGLVLTAVLAWALPGTARAGVTIDYAAKGVSEVLTGQTAQATFDFVDNVTLKITWRETTTTTTVGDSAGRIATSIGFAAGALPAGVAPRATTKKNGNSSVKIGANSMAVDFDAGSFAANADVSGEYGTTHAAADPGTAGYADLLQGNSYYWVSGNNSHMTRFNGADLDGPNSGGLNGPQGGLSNFDSLGGGLGFIKNEVEILLKLSGGGLDAAQQQHFLSLIQTGANSFVEWGSDAAFGTPTVQSVVPEPSTLAGGLVGLMFLGLGRRAHRRRHNAA